MLPPHVNDRAVGAGAGVHLVVLVGGVTPVPNPAVPLFASPVGGPVAGSRVDEHESALKHGGVGTPPSRWSGAPCSGSSR